MGPSPTDRKYSKTHEWFQVAGDVVTVGITQFAADQLTDITYVDLPAVGTTVQPGKPCGEIESVKATSELFCAVSGKVVAVNGRLADEPGLLNTDPFDAGWMLKIECPDPSPLNNLLDGPAYDKMVSEH